MSGDGRATGHLLVDKAFMLTLSAPEMTTPLGGMHVLHANAGQSELRAIAEVYAYKDAE